jgi:transcriptional regulator with XRE-family HTH domain
MAPKQPYRTRNYAVAELLLALRSRAKLTQSQFAQRLGISRRSIQKWESGETYPTSENLRALISLMLTLGIFTEGHERDEAADLWQQVSRASPQRLPLFDAGWFDQLLAARTGIEGNTSPVTADPFAAYSASPQHAPGDPSVPLKRDVPLRAQALPFPATPLIGRDAELSKLASLLADPACRLLTLLGPRRVRSLPRLAMRSTFLPPDGSRLGKTPRRTCSAICARGTCC